MTIAGSHILSYNKTYQQSIPVKVVVMKKAAKLMFGTCAALTGSLAVMHTAEWFLVGRKVAKAAGMPVKEALPQCLLRGFLWWKPLKKDLGLD